MPVRPKTSARRNVEYDMRTKRVLSRRGCCLMWVNLVNKEVMQPIRLPTRKLAQKMPKKSRIAWKRRRLILSLNKRCIAVLCVLPTFIRCQALYSQLTRVVHPPLTFSSKSFKA